MEGRLNTGSVLLSLIVIHLCSAKLNSDTKLKGLSEDLKGKYSEGTQSFAAGSSWIVQF